MGIMKKGRDAAVQRTLLRPRINLRFSPKGIGEAVAKHRHFAAMAHWTRDKGEAPTRLACVGVLNPLHHTDERKTGV
ncbi:hypothetical protein DNTS_031281, partial [Danionella cerebrum]